MGSLKFQQGAKQRGLVLLSRDSADVDQQRLTGGDTENGTNVLGRRRNSGNPVVDTCEAPSVTSRIRLQSGDNGVGNRDDFGIDAALPKETVRNSGEARISGQRVMVNSDADGNAGEKSNQLAEDVRIVSVSNQNVRPRLAEFAKQTDRNANVIKERRGMR